MRFPSTTVIHIFTTEYLLLYPPISSPKFETIWILVPFDNAFCPLDHFPATSYHYSSLIPDGLHAIPSVGAWYHAWRPGQTYGISGSVTTYKALVHNYSNNFRSRRPFRNSESWIGLVEVEIAYVNVQLNSVFRVYFLPSRRSRSISNLRASNRNSLLHF